MEHTVGGPNRHGARTLQPGWAWTLYGNQATYGVLSLALAADLGRLSSVQGHRDSFSIRPKQLGIHISLSLVHQYHEGGKSMR